MEQVYAATVWESIRRHAGTTRHGATTLAEACTQVIRDREQRGLLWRAEAEAVRQLAERDGLLIHESEARLLAGDR